LPGDFVSTMSAINGKYILEREIGRGASGAVWVARDVTLGRQVAIKLLRRDCMDDPAAQSLFEREAWTIAQLKSPHVVNVYDAGIHDCKPFIVMELLDGESLEARLQRQPCLPLSIAARIVADIARGLTMTHRRGIVHRDLKPANVFLARDHEGEVAKLLDFGIATLMAGAEGDAATRGPPSVMAGTPHYMSPEQITGLEVDHRADLWALAILAYQMLTGTFPFDGETVAKLRVSTCSGSFLPVSSLVPKVGSAADAFFLRALAPNPGDRFQSAADLATELAGLSEHEAKPVTRVLFVDDEPDVEFLVRQRFRHQLRDAKFEFHFALDGAAALDVLRGRPDIDVVVTDLNMPTMDGLAFLRQVPEVSPLVRVVVVSAYSDMANIRAAMNLGAFDFLGKPIDFDDLERTISKCAVETSDLRRALRAQEENGMLRALVGPGAADRLVASLRTAHSLAEESFEGSVAFVGVHGMDDWSRHQPVATLFELLNAQIGIFGRDILAHGGVVSHFVGAALLAVFRGEGHLERAIDACLAIRDRMRVTDADATGPSGARVGPGGAIIGLDSGLLLTGGVGSVELGRIGHTVLGDTLSTSGRLVAIAGRNEILVSARIEPSVSKDFVCEPHGAPASSRHAAAVFRVVGRDRSKNRADGAPLTASETKSIVPNVLTRAS
jgi:eukaryotic-like serine/threonine-protein kinase